MREYIAIEPESDLSDDIERVGIGYKADAVETDDYHITPGDLAVFSDPDAGLHGGQCELVMSETTVAYVDGVYGHWLERENAYALELSVTGPLGRVNPADPYVAVVGEHTVIDAARISDASRMASTLADHDEYDSYYQRTTHLGPDGTPDDLWGEYDDDDRSGPGCSVCRGDEGTDGVVITGE
jgi:hypothetical protein